MAGRWGFATEDEKDHVGRMFFDKLPYTSYTTRPAQLDNPNERQSHLWQYAIFAILLEIRRNNWPWSYFKDRRDARNRFIQLGIRSKYYGRILDSDELQELAELHQGLYPPDARRYYSEVDLGKRLGMHG